MEIETSLPILGTSCHQKISLENLALLDLFAKWLFRGLVGILGFLGVELSCFDWSKKPN